MFDGDQLARAVLMEDNVVLVPLADDCPDPAGKRRECEASCDLRLESEPGERRRSNNLTRASRDRITDVVHSPVDPAPI